MVLQSLRAGPRTRVSLCALMFRMRQQRPGRQTDEETDSTAALQQPGDTPARWLSAAGGGQMWEKVGCTARLCDFRRDACHLQSQFPICARRDLQEQISRNPKNAGRGQVMHRHLHARLAAPLSRLHDGWVHDRIRRVSRAEISR